MSQIIDFDILNTNDVIDLDVLDNSEAIDLDVREGGGGGTTDYNMLSNKPQINGVTLTGNKTSADLGIQTIPTGGTEGQVLAKASDSDYDAEWVDAPGGDVTQEAFDALVEYVHDLSPVTTVSGAIAAVDDAAPLDAEGLVVSIDPVQDLHGYDSPWPAGGGKNKFDLSAIEPYNSAVTVTKTTNAFSVSNANSYAVNAFRGADGDLVFPVVDGSYSISVATAAMVNIGVYGSSDGESFSWLANGITVGNTSAAFTVSGQTYIKFIAYVGQDISATFDRFQFELGSTATSYAPYSNVCPITGWTGARVTAAGKNLIQPLNADNAIKFNGSSLTVANVSNGIAVTGQNSGSNHSVGFVIAEANNYIGMTLTLSVDMSGNGGSPQCNFVVCDSQFGNRNVLGYRGTSGAITATIPQNASGKYLGIALFSTSGQDSNTIVSTYTDFQLELGSTATAYEPYTGDTYSVSWQTEAGTVYGGTLDLTQGKLVVDRAMIVFDGSEDEVWNKSQYNYFSSAKISGALDVNANANNFMSNKYSYSNIANNTENIGACIIWAQIRVRLPDMSISLEDWKQSLNDVPMQVIYKLATPVTYDLTPHEIALLRGSNTLFADTGDTSLTYRQDVGILLSKLTAQVAALNAAVANS